MNKITVLLMSFLFLTFGVNLTAQELTQGTIVLELTDISSEDEQTAAGLEMMKGMSTTYVFNDKYAYSTMDMMGGMIKSTSLMDRADEKMDLLIDAMGNKMYIESTKAERDELQSNDQMAELLENVDIKYHDEDTKEILGYKCTKVTISPKEGAEDEVPMKFILYVAKDIKASSQMIQQFQSFDIDGFPLEFTIDMNVGTMTYTTTELSKEVDEKLFKIKTAGYQKMTMKEFSEQMQGMGGMGF